MKLSSPTPPLNNCCTVWAINSATLDGVQEEEGCGLFGSLK